MEQEYKVGVAWRIFYALLVIGVITFISVLIFPLPKAHPVVLLIPMPIAIFCLLVLINLFKSKVIITDTSITRIRIFYNKTLNFEDIKGVRFGNKVIMLEPKDASLGNLRISNYNDFTNDGELTKFISNKFADLNKKDKETANKLLLQDENLGSTPNERQAKADRVKQVGIAYMVWGFVMCLILVCVNNVYTSFFAGIIYPILGIILMKNSYGLIKFVSNIQKSVSLGIAIGFFWPVILIFVTAVINYELLSFHHVWLIAAGIGFVLFLLLYNTGINKATGSVVGQAIFMLVLCLFFGFGTTIVSNCLFDTSASLKYRTIVEDTYITTGKGSHYHLTLTPWKPGRNTTSIDVPRSEYEKSPVGTPVQIEEKQGLFNIPWFTYTINPTPSVPAGSNSGNSPVPR